MKKVLLLLLSMSLFSCSSDGDSTPIPTPTGSSVAYFKVSLDGTTLNYSQNNSSNPTHYCQPSYGFRGNGFDRSHYYSSMMMPYPSINSYPALSLSFNNMYQTDDSSTETAVFHSLFTNTPTNFISYEENNNWIKGISVTYTNQDGISYSTEDGDQTGSTMTVTSSISGMDSGSKIQTIVGTVNCKLYNIGNPDDFIVLTNGKYKLIFQEYN